MISPALDEEAIFKVAREIASPEARAIYLQQACAENLDLQNRVVTLLRALEQQPGFLESPAASIVTTKESVSEQIGSRIGPYKLLQELGEGGMGVVFVAEQKEPVQRHVALKLIRPGMDSRQVIARFEAERQALALMDHSGIAKVLDAGTTDSGRPFFVMELVRGIQITEYCDQHQLTPKQRLLLFVQVCHAVQHAHQKGVIHRDLKPSNVLVAQYDEEPVVKIIDFGVVKAMGQPLTEKTMFTQVGQLVGTIEYMSPEQARLNQLDVDTRTDIYSLGVLLYELLTGETPFEQTRLHAAAIDERLRIIREEDPPRPSTRLSTSGALLSIAAQRHTEPKRLATIVRGELDWIVMKALEKDRSRRYQTANAMAMDIQRYLVDEPVLACPPSAVYRFRKLARRNKTAVLATALVAVALLVGSIVSVWQAVRATRAEQVALTARVAESEARRTAEAERNKAETQRAEADNHRLQAVANLKQARAAVDESFTLVSESKLLDVPGLQPLRMELLESALRFYQGFALEHSGDPRTMSDVATTYLRIAQINTAINQNDDAINAVKQAIDIIDQLRREHPDDRESQVTLAGFSTDRRWMKRGTELPRNPLAAFQTLLRLQRLWEQLAAEHPTTVGFQSDLAAIHATIGALLQWSGREQESAEYLRKSVTIGEKLVQDDPARPQYRSVLADVSLQLSTSQSNSGFDDEALALVRRSTDLRQGLVDDFPGVPDYRAGLVSSLVGLGDRTLSIDPEQAEQSYRRAFELALKMINEFPGQILYLQNWAASGIQLATFRCTRGKLAESEVVLQQMLETLRGQAASNFKYRKARDGLAFGCFYVANRVPPVPSQAATSEQLLQLSLTLFSELAKDFPDVDTFREHTAHCHQALGWRKLLSFRLEEAVKHYRIAVALFESVSGIPSAGVKMAPFLAGAYRSLSEVLDRQNNTDESFDAACEAMRLSPNEPAHQVRLVQILSEMDDPNRRQQGLSLLTPLLDSQPQDAPAWALRGQIHAAMGRIDESAADFVKLIDQSDDGPWSESPRKRVARTLAQSAEVFEKVLALRPKETTLWIGRGQFHALRSRWSEAVDDYAKVIDDRSISDASFEYAALLVLLNDRPRYNEFCRRLVARTGDPQGWEAYSLARTCAIGPALDIDPVDIANWAARGSNSGRYWELTTLALAEVRAGNFESAIQNYNQSNSQPGSEGVSARNFFGLAIAHASLGRTEAAYESLEQGRRLFQRAHSTKPDGRAIVDIPGEWIEQNVLSREAETLLQAPPDSDL